MYANKKIKVMVPYQYLDGIKLYNVDLFTQCFYFFKTIIILVHWLSFWEWMLFTTYVLFYNLYSYGILDML